MFEPSALARVFALPPGVDFPRALVQGLVERFDGQPPEALARVQLIVNTSRMARRIRDLFDAGPARLLPRISLLTEIDRHSATDLPPPVSPLRRRLQLARLISHLLDREPDLASRASVYSLADSLAGLMDEMQGEGVTPDVIRGLDVSDMSGHWARAQRFFDIAETYLSALDGMSMDAQARMRQAVQGLIETWRAAPPREPIILAGSTGSRGTTAMLMAAVARLPQGAIVLPGYDFDQPDAVWSGLERALHSEDHPQYRFKRLMRIMEIGPLDIRPWRQIDAPSPARNRLVSLALRPAPITDAWLNEGPGLTGLAEAVADLTLVQAPDPRSEALAIALRLREAAETGQRAALITPDRMLTRQVAAALDRWDILPDDSAGLPLQLSPPGRFLRHVAGLFAHRLTGEALLTLLKHPLCHAGDQRNTHILQTRDLELHLRRFGPPFPTAQSLTHACLSLRNPPPEAWINWLTEQFCDRDTAAALPLGDWTAMLRQSAERLSAGSAADGSGTLWDKNAGQAALAVLVELSREAEHGGEMTARDFTDLLGSLLSAAEVRDRDAPHDRIMIWGTLEARVQGADLLILGGLNEGSWPETPDPDPWLNRALRDRAGLLLPERRIGLAAHDFQQAVNAPEVWLTRALRSEDAETVPSRWLNRMTNLLNGLPQQNGPGLVREMLARGRVWLDWAAELDAVEQSRPAPRPTARPPVAARPRQLSVTEIKKLIRDPYAIYARHVLRLKPLDPLVKAPDALLRGIAVHDFLEEFIRHSVTRPETLNRAVFLEQAEHSLGQAVPWPAIRRLWLARLARIADGFLDNERIRQSLAQPVAFEAVLDFPLAPLDFKLVGRADRIDRDDTGALRIYDYKTGAPPTEKEQRLFDRQLLIEAAVAEEGGFDRLDAAPVSAAEFLRVGAPGNDVAAPLDKEPTQKVLAELRRLIAVYFEPDQGFTARRMLQKDSDVSDYDQLSRFGEWDRTTIPTPVVLT